MKNILSVKLQEFSFDIFRKQVVENYGTRNFQSLTNDFLQSKGKINLSGKIQIQITIP